MISKLCGFIGHWWLILSAHLAAFRLAPGPYVTAAKWRMLGKRVRARAQFAPLLARTRHAYALHVRRQELATVPSPAGLPPIIALVKSTGDDALLSTTLTSLAAEQIEAHVIGCASAAKDLETAATSIEWALRPWLLPLTEGDCLAAGAALAYREAIAATTCSVIYADDDRIDPEGKRGAPHFKPDWNAELVRHHDYVTGSCLVQVEHEDLGFAGHELDWQAALLRCAGGNGSGAMHLPKTLHHRRSRPDPMLPLPAPLISPRLPRVTAIIPTRNRSDLLGTCIAGVETADYPDIEIAVVDNGSDDPATLAFLASLPERTRPGRDYRVLRHPGAFNYSAINNCAVRETRGELICLLNNDIEMTASDWLAIMATHALRDDVGAVGAQLLYPDGRIQHAGVVIGVGNAAGHAHRFLTPADEGYFHRHALPQFVTAVTAACMLIRRDRFLAVGGLDETNFPVAFNDVDLCLRLNGKGWQSFYEPRAVLVHHESVSRGYDRDPVGAARFARELAALQRLWHTDEVVDPFHHPQLSRASEQFALSL